MSQVTAETYRLIDTALAEDVGSGDITTDILIPRDLIAKGVVLVKSEGVLAGLDVAMTVFSRIDSTVQAKVAAKDGDFLEYGTVVAEIYGSVASMLRVERTALNFLQRLSGIATVTRNFVNAVRDYNVRIMDTRKTTPGFRVLEKYAVRVGGGQNHRSGLSDGILVKDNHIAAMRQRGMVLEDIVRKAMLGAPHAFKVEVEVENLDQVNDALSAGAEVLLLDNMPAKQISEALKIVGGRAVTEASGGVTLENVADIAATGVDFISIGGLTHSANVLDMSFELL